MISASSSSRLSTRVSISAGFLDPPAGTTRTETHDARLTAGWSGKYTNATSSRTTVIRSLLFAAALELAAVSNGSAQQRPPLSPSDIADIVTLERIEDRRD